MTASFTLLYPPRIECGWGCRRLLPEVVAELVGEASYCVVSGRSLHGAGAATEVEQLLGPAALRWDRVPPEPRLSDLDGLITALRGSEVGLVVAIGGGSVIDVGKAAAAIAPAADRSRPYFDGEAAFAGRGIPFVALPTTAGTGAEVTKNSVLIDPATKVKRSIRHPVMVPAAALVDAELTVSMPPSVTAAAGMDALTQAIESRCSARANAVSAALAERATGLIVGSLGTAFGCGQDRAAREAMAGGSLLSAMAFSQSGLGAVHGLAHPIGAALKLGHGGTCAVLLPHILRFNAPCCGDALSALAAACGLTGADAFIARVEALCGEVGIPSDFAEHGLEASHFPSIVATCRSNSMRGNPRPMADRQVLDLLRALARST